MNVRTVSLLAAAAVSLAACSTTATTSEGDDIAVRDGGSATSQDSTPSAGQASSGGGANESGGPPSSDGAAPAGGSGSANAGSGPTQSPSSGTGSNEPGDGSRDIPPSAPVGPKLVTGSGHGYTEDEIFVGIQLVVDTEAGFAAVGASAAAPDEEGIANTMVEYINSTGGIAGRTLVPVYHRSEALTGTWASQAAATCTTFTQDVEVVAIVTSATGGSDALWDCTSQSGVPVVERNIWPWDDRYFTERPDMLYVPGKMSSSRWVDLYIDGLDELDFFEGATVGILHFDGQPFERLLEGKMLPALARHGISEPEVTAITRPPSVGDFGNMTAEINNALVRYRSLGVTHIVMLEWAGILPFFALPSADQQRYYPQWGFTSNDIPATLNTIPAPDQLENGQGVSWVPPTDVALLEPADDPGRYQREAKCREAYGYGAGHHNGSMCDALLFLQTALNRATALTPAGLASSVRSMGTDFQSPMAVSTHFSGGVFHDGASATRLFDWQEGCWVSDGEEEGCYQYVSPARPARR